MKLELDEHEVKAILLQYADQQWPGCFNTVNSTSYHSIASVELTKTEPKQPDELLRAVA